MFEPEIGMKVSYILRSVWTPCYRCITTIGTVDSLVISIYFTQEQSTKEWLKLGSITSKNGKLYKRWMKTIMQSLWHDNCIMEIKQLFIKKLQLCY